MISVVKKDIEEKMKLRQTLEHKIKEDTVSFCKKELKIVKRRS